MRAIVIVHACIIILYILIVLLVKNLLQICSPPLFHIHILIITFLYFSLLILNTLPFSRNGTGEGAAIRKDAALGDKSVLGVHPPSREAALVANYVAPDDFSTTFSGGGQAKSTLQADGINQEAAREEQGRDAVRSAKARGVSPEISYAVVDENVRVCIVGSPKTASVSVVTVHDVATTYRNGLLQVRAHPPRHTPPCLALPYLTFSPSPTYLSIPI